VTASVGEDAGGVGVTREQELMRRIEALEEGLAALIKAESSFSSVWARDKEQAVAMVSKARTETWYLLAGGWPETLPDGTRRWHVPANPKAPAP
jgi:hypothetical protein